MPGRPDSRRPTSIAAGFATLIWAIGLGGAAAAQDGPGSTPRADGGCAGLQICRVDAATFVGWRVFEARCSVCHAPDAAGSAFAPSLLDRVAAMDWRAFVAAMEQGYLGAASAVEPRGADPYVNRHYRELWRYLSARADGDVPAGRLAPLPADRR